MNFACMSLFLALSPVKILKMYSMYSTAAVLLRCEPQRGISFFPSGEILVNPRAELSWLENIKSYFLELLISPLCTLTMYDLSSRVPRISLSLFLSQSHKCCPEWFSLNGGPGGRS